MSKTKLVNKSYFLFLKQFQYVAKEIKIKVESKPSIKSAVNYSNGFVKKISREKYADKKRVTGKELTSLTPLKQINFIFIYILLQTWKSEMRKLKSPYFDFKSDEVQAALDEFMNTLSRNISIRKDDFEPILKKSYQLSLLYYNSPIQFLGEIFQEKVTLDEMIELNKMVKSNFNMGIIAFMEEEGMDELVFEELEPDSLEQEDPTEFLGTLWEFLEIEHKEESSEEPATFVNQFKVNAQPNLNDQFQDENKQPTLNDQHQAENKTILESHAESKLESLTQNIPLNEQYQLTNSVFGGMKSVYDSFIQKLDGANSFADATLLVDEFVSKTEHPESNEYLHNLVDRKFMS